MNWLRDYAQAAAKTDRLKDRPNHQALLVAGLMGEVGSIVAEVKKAEREKKAYPYQHSRVLEEFGDFLWYFVRLASIRMPDLLSNLYNSSAASTGVKLDLALALGKAVASIVDASNNSSAQTSRTLRDALISAWICLLDLSKKSKIDLRRAAEANLRKTQSRWPLVRKYAPLFDDRDEEEDQLPRRLEVEFIERRKREVILRCNGLNFGDRITDNIQDSDNYRFHDIFHFSHAVHLGWSPVMRKLLSCKRKSKPRIDEAEDGARASILEEAIAATVFNRAKEAQFFKDLDHLDYDLLKSIKGFIRGYEVARIPLWQWETAILDGYRVFRLLRSNRGGTVILDLRARTLNFIPPSRARRKRGP